MNERCIIDIKGSNKYFENDTVPGLVTLEQENNSFCSQAEKKVIIDKCECNLLNVLWRIIMIIYKFSECSS